MLCLPQFGQTQTRRAPQLPQKRPLLKRPQRGQRHLAAAPVCVPGGVDGIALLRLFSTAACQEETSLETALWISSEAECTA